MHTTSPQSTPAGALRSIRVYRAVAVVLVVAFLAAIGGFYHPDTGFTVFIGFGSDHDAEVPALREISHHHGGSGYDGQFYAQLALVPLVKDPAIDRALDNPPYRARRILFSWTAYVAGLGRPAWVLQAYAIQNVVCWLALAWLLCRWIPPDTCRGLALWAACLFSQGMLVSVLLALTDGPSMVLIAIAAAAAEGARTLAASSILGIAALGRETNLLALTMLPWPRRRRDWVRTAVAVIVAALPLLLWQDYLWSIYRTQSLANQNQLAMPFTAVIAKGLAAFAMVGRHPFWSPQTWNALATLGLVVQIIYLAVRWRPSQPWWRIGIVYAALICSVHSVVWEGIPGAAVRVGLPATIAFNILLTHERPRAFWIWYALGNAALLAAPATLGW
jgi:hypothetical protein